MSGPESLDPYADLQQSGYDHDIASGLWLPEPVDWDKFWSREDEEHEFLVPGIVPVGRSVALYALAKAGKSLFVLEASAALATGRSVLGGPAGPPRRVMYLDLEMTEDDLKERLADFGYGEGDDLSNLRYYVLPDLPPLDSAEGAKALGELIDRDQPELIVIDTHGRVVDGPEDQADTVRSYHRHAGLIMKRAGVAVLRLDHQGKATGKGQRGSSAKNDDVDIVWHLQSDAHGIELTRERSRVSRPEGNRCQGSGQPVKSPTAGARSSGVASAA